MNITVIDDEDSGFESENDRKLIGEILVEKVNISQDRLMPFIQKRKRIGEELVDDNQARLTQFAGGSESPLAVSLLISVSIALLIGFAVNNGIKKALVAVGRIANGD